MHYWTRGYYRSPKTTQERCASLDVEHKQYVRAKRNFHNLPNTYDDIHSRPERKTWKRKRKTQFQLGKRVEHKIILNVEECKNMQEYGFRGYYGILWKLEEFCERNNYTFREDRHYDTFTRQYIETGYWGWSEGTYPYYTVKRNNGVYEQVLVGYRKKRVFIEYETPLVEERKYSMLREIVFTYWTREARPDLCEEKV